MRKIVLLIAAIFILILLLGGTASAESTGELTVEIADLPNDAEDVYVSVEGQTGTQERVGEDGTVTLEGLEPQTYSVWASYNGSSTDAKSVDVEAGSEERLTFQWPLDNQDPLNSALATERFK